MNLLEQKEFNREVHWIDSDSCCDGLMRLAGDRLKDFYFQLFVYYETIIKSII